MTDKQLEEMADRILEKNLLCRLLHTFTSKNQCTCKPSTMVILKQIQTETARDCAEIAEVKYRDNSKIIKTRYGLEG